LRPGLFLDTPDPLQPAEMAAQFANSGMTPKLQISDDRIADLQAALGERNQQILLRERNAVEKQTRTDLGLYEAEMRSRLSAELERLTRSDHTLLQLQLKQLAVETKIAVHTGPVREAAILQLADIVRQIDLRIKGREIAAAAVRNRYLQQLQDFREQTEAKAEAQIETRSAELLSDQQRILLGYRRAMTAAQISMPGMEIDLSLPTVPYQFQGTHLASAPAPPPISGTVPGDTSRRMQNDTLERIRRLAVDRGWRLVDKPGRGIPDRTAEVIRALFGNLR
jgi:hypothetical protein